MAIFSVQKPGVVRIVVRWVMRGEIHDSKTICGLMMAREAVARRKL